MKTLTVNIENDEDLDVLIPLLKRLNMPFHTDSSIKTPYLKASATNHHEFMRELNSLAGKKGQSFSFGDAVEYQNEVRRDRKMPFRDE